MTPAENRLMQQVSEFNTLLSSQGGLTESQKSALMATYEEVHKDGNTKYDQAVQGLLNWPTINSDGTVRTAGISSIDDIVGFVKENPLVLAVPVGFVLLNSMRNKKKK